MSTELKRIRFCNVGHKCAFYFAGHLLRKNSNGSAYTNGRPNDRWVFNGDDLVWIEHTQNDEDEDNYLTFQGWKTTKFNQTP